MDIEKAQLFLSTLSPAKAIQLLNAIRYYPSHRALLKLGSQVQDDPENDGLLSLACAAYGWMPTILKNWKFENFNSKNPVTIAKNLSDVTSAIEFLKKIDPVSPINNSWVGLSKTLHFLNPELFPIWDSRVAKHFRLNWAGQLNKKDVYIAFFIFIHENLAKHSEILTAVADHIEKAHDYRPSYVRCLELLLFETVTA